ncbi:MAG: N-formylglutamate amidohydrolase [Polyangiales bacterium]
MSLLGPDDPAPHEVVRPTGGSRFVLTADHAGRRLPRALGDLGVSASELARHIAYDLGIEALARAVSARLDAFLILQTYSRLAIDPNRPPGVPQSITARSERTDIPGNLDLAPDAIEARQRELFWPYHHRITAELDQRKADGREAVLIALHSFTPVYMDDARPFHAGVLYNRDPRLARALLARLRDDSSLVVGDNEPYALGDLSDYTVPTHGEKRGLLHVEIEVRQDLLADEVGVTAWADRLARDLERAYADVVG